MYLLLFPALTASCAKLQPTATGYLSSYDFATAATLPATTDPAATDSAATDSPATPPLDHLAGIDSFYIEDLAWRVPQAKGFDQPQQTAILETLRVAITREFAVLKPIVTAPGPASARIRMAITDATRANAGLNALSSLLIGPVSNGGASVEGEVLSPNGRQLAAISQGKNGSPFQIMGFYSQKSHAQSVASAIVRALAGKLDPSFETKRAAALNKNAK